MLEQLKLVTEGRARAVTALRPNLRSLFEGYEAEPDPDRRADMLTDGVVRFSLHPHKVYVSCRVCYRLTTGRMVPCQERS